MIVRDECNKTYSEIKELAGVPTPTIRRIVKSGEPRHNQNPRLGRQTKLSARDIRRLVRAVTSFRVERKASYVKLAKNLEIQALESIIRRALQRAGFQQCVACPMPLITWINWQKSLKWAREHLHREIEA